MKNLKEQLNLFLISIIICYFIINFKKDSINIYSLMALAIPAYFIIFLNFNLKKNYKLTLKLFTTSLAVLSYGYYFYFIDFYSHEISLFELIISNLFLSLSIYMGAILLKYEKNSFIKSEELEPIIYKRKADLKRIVTYLDKFESIGINAKWGDGKSFILEKLKGLKEVKEKYEFIEIDILSCNIDELQNIIINELENVLYKNEIISNYSHRLKEILKISSLMSSIKNVFSKNYSSYSETIQGFKNELNKLDKKILIIYEDIDRINNIDNIKKVFAISEKLANERIKIIYQYEDKNLYDIGLTQSYLEKYIRYKINLTPLNFFEIIDFMFEHNQFKNIIKDDFKFLDENMQQINFRKFNNNFQLGKTLYFSFNPISIRKVQSFLNELDNIFSDSKKFIENKKIVINTVFLKHFFPEQYEKIDVAKELYETFSFKIYNKIYSLQELYDNFKKGEISSELLEVSFLDESNRNNLCILSFYGFDLILNNQIFEDNKQRIKEIYEESLTELKIRNNNEKINRTVWKVIANGKSEYTDYEDNANDLRDNVLSKSENELEVAFEEFYNKRYNFKGWEENGTIDLMGIPFFIQLAKALQLIEISEELKIKFLKFYLNYKKEQAITKEFIQIINYFEYGSKDFYIKKLQIINELSINGNLNSEDCFKKFLRNSINSINSYRIMRIHHFDIDNFLEDPEFVAKTMLEGEIEKLLEIKNRIKNTINSLKIDYELDILINFIRKMQEIILTKEASRRADKSSGISITTGKPNQDEYTRLKNLKINESTKFADEINKSIEEDKISIYEVSELIEL